MNRAGTPKLACPACGHRHSLVVDVRTLEDVIVRRHQCKACQHRYNSEQFVSDRGFPSNTQIKQAQKSF